MESGLCQPIVLAIALAVAACEAPKGPDPIPQAVVLGPVAPRFAALEGQVDFGPPEDRQLTAKFAEVGSGATVSLIDPVEGNTVSTTLTTPEGRFRLTILSGNFEPGVGPYFLEAVKGLAVGGKANRVGASAARVRTLVSYSGSGWRSLTTGTLGINRSTTAISALSNLKGLTKEQNLALLDTIESGRESTADGITTNDTFTAGPAISDGEYRRTWDLVAQALREDADPIGSLFLRPTDATSSSLVSIGPGFGMREGIAWAHDGFTLSGLSPVDAAPGDRVTVYGHGLPLATDSVAIVVGEKACPVVATDGVGTAITFVVPTGAVTGNVEFRYGPWINRSLFLIVN